LLADQLTITTHKHHVLSSHNNRRTLYIAKGMTPVQVSGVRSYVQGQRGPSKSVSVSACLLTAPLGEHVSQYR